MPKINIHGHLRHDQDIEARVRLWQQWNVVHFCCLCLQEDFLPEYFTNEDFLRIKDRYGSLLIGFAGVNVRVDRIDGPADIGRYKDLGFRGLKFLGNSYPYSHDVYFPIYEAAQELGMPVFFHTGWLAGAQPEDRETNRRFRISAENMRPYHLDRIARVFPDLKIIGAHLGFPHPHEALTMVERYENVYYGFSGDSGRLRRVRDILAVLLPHPALETDFADPEQNRALVWFEKFCFATDNPEPSCWVPNSQRIMDRLMIPEDTRRRFYYDNAARILGLQD